MSEPLRLAAGAAWALRQRAEREAARRFARLAGAIGEFDPGSPLVAMLLRGADDELRHAGLYAELCASYGQALEPEQPERRIAPPLLSGRQAALYEMVAACCITETESVATLATLLSERADPHIHVILHEVARDEVMHSRMGWAHLSREAGVHDVTFLSRWLPAMLSGAVEAGLFLDGPPEPDAEELPRHGLLPRARRREIFTRTLLEVVLPGLARFGVDPAPGRAWLSGQEASAAPAQPGAVDGG